MSVPTSNGPAGATSTACFGPAPRVADRVWLGAPVDGGERTVQAPPDKAISQRATLLAALAGGASRLSGLADCLDTRANLDALARLGVACRSEQPRCLVVEGTDGRRMAYAGPPLDAGNSATTARLLLAVLAGGDSRCAVTGNALLTRRPMGWLVDPLRSLGADLRYLDRDGRLPVGVRGAPLRGGEVDVAVDSAQAVSALLFAGLLADGPVLLRRRTAARDHTERLLRWTGVEVVESAQEVRLHPARPSAFELTVPGDPSAAAVLAALHLASPGAGSWLYLPGVCLNPRRLGFFDIVAAMGAQVRLTEDGSDGPEPAGTVAVRRTGPLRGVRVATGALVQSGVDELPLVAALATQAGEATVISDAAELRDKDSDRIGQTVALLRAFGGRAEPTDDGLVVYPSPLCAPERLEVAPDHRIVFAALTLGVLCGGGVELAGVSAAAVSYPGILADLRRYVAVEER
jgi:3-phosphoshikimate 1-carboxyvinyltransferase